MRRLTFDPTRIRRLALISLILQTTKGVAGRTRLQKITYLVNLIGWNSKLNFKFHDYGTYSETLVKEVVGMVNNDWIEESASGTPTGNTMFNYHIPRNRQSITNSIISRVRDVDEHLVTRTIGLTRQLNEFSREDLEIMSTLAFLRNTKSHLNDDQLVELANQLKPHFDVEAFRGGLRIFNILRPFLGRTTPPLI